MAVNSNCQNVKGAVQAVAKSMNISEDDALRVLVARGAEDIARSMSSPTGLDGVRAHTSSSGPASMGAQAYAQGANVHVAPGSGGTGLIGHEVTHTIQQSTRRIEAASARGTTSGTR